MFSTLLFPLDRSVLAEQVIGAAASIARGAHAGISERRRRTRRRGADVSMKPLEVL